MFPYSATISPVVGIGESEAIGRGGYYKALKAEFSKYF